MNVKEAKRSAEITMRKDYQQSMDRDFLQFCIDNETSIIVVNFDPHLVATDGPTKKRIVSGLVYQDEDTYMLSLITEQSTGMIKKILSKGNPLIVRGIFSKELFIGNEGESYRPIIGKLDFMK